MSDETDLDLGTQYENLSEAEKCCFNARLYKKAQSQVRQALEFFETYCELDPGSFEVFEEFIGKMSSPDGLRFSKEFLERFHQEASPPPDPEENPFDDLDENAPPQLPTEKGVLGLLMNLDGGSGPTVFTAALLAEILPCQSKDLSRILKNLRAKGVISPDPHQKAPSGGVMWVVNLEALGAEVGK